MRQLGMFGVLGFLGVFTSSVATGSHAIESEPCAIKRLNASGHPDFYEGKVSHEENTDIWSAAYIDNSGEVSKVQGPAKVNPTIFELAREPVVGFNDPELGVLNVVPLKWVLDTTQRPYRVALLVRYLNKRQGEAVVDASALVPALTQTEGENLRSNGEPERVKVAVGYLRDGQRAGVEGYIFMTAPFTLKQQGGAALSLYRGVYRSGGRNIPFAVDAAEFLTAYALTKHQRTIQVVDGVSRTQSQPLAVLVDLAGERVELFVALSMPTLDKPLYMPLDGFSCGKAILRQAPPIPGYSIANSQGQHGASKRR